ncbi:MAG: type IV pilus biogenesis/stability protein PilW [Pseudomonadales bacterium]|jgi:type IV pilus assembly protein PilF|nr:type IV pilus biogenesis/stability protein PilW [Pseudomonadales bacterium]
MRRRGAGPWIRLLAPLVLALLAQGCVTTTNSTFKADEQAEVASRVKAATDYLNQGNPEKAIVHLKRALELDPDSAPVHDTLAQVFWKSGEYELAEEHFRKAIGSDPQFSRARNNYAAFLYERGDTRGAIRELEHVVADTLYESRGAAFANLGRAYQKLGETAKAEEALSRAVKMDRRQWPAMLELAQISYDRGDYEPATRYYEQFRRLAPRQTPRSLVLGIRLARLAGDRDAEASYSLQLKSMYPDSVEYREFSRTPSER